MTAHKVIIDTDPGIDDSMAILFALMHNEIDLVGLTTIFGNVTVDVGTRNARALCEMVDKSVPVAKGAATPLIQPPRPIADFVHGAEGFGTVAPMIPAGKPDPRSAAHFICDTVNAHPGEIVLCPVGPLTNLALALKYDPSIAQKVKAVHVMGASLKAGGNASAYAEANIWQDPHAAETVFKAKWDIKLIGLDITQQVKCNAADFSALAKAAPKLGGFLDEAVQFYFQFHEKHEGFYGCYMHDVMAVISIIRPELFSFDEDAVHVIVEGERAGETQIIDAQGHPRVKWGSAVRGEEVKDIFFSTLATTF